MGLAMAVFKTKCDCGQNILVNVGDRLYNNTIQWFQSYNCINCGKSIEMDSVDEIPLEIKLIIMEQEGTYGLFLKYPKDRAKVEFIIKKLMTDKLKKFDLFLEKKSDEIIKGTQNEVLVVKNYLEKKGISSHIVKLH